MIIWKLNGVNIDCIYWLEYRRESGEIMDLIKELNELSIELNDKSCCYCPYSKGCRYMSDNSTGGYSLCYLLCCIVEALEYGEKGNE